MTVKPHNGSTPATFIVLLQPFLVQHRCTSTNVGTHPVSPRTHSAVAVVTSLGTLGCFAQVN